jgi:hypothetical protein
MDVLAAYFYRCLPSSVFINMHKLQVKTFLSCGSRLKPEEALT